MDFIVKLPLSSGFDSILVIGDHLTKGAHFIPCKESMDLSALASLFLTHFFRHHGLPGKIVTNRGPTFVSAFWWTVQKALQIHSAPSTSYHPQTERTNQKLETYLRHFCSHQQDDWSNWLPIAEFSFNNTTSTSTKLSPFFAWQGFHPRANSFTAPSKVPTANAYVALLEDVQLALGEALRHSKEVQSRFYNSHTQPSSVYNPNDLVWLSRRYIPSTRPSTKLDYRRVGPFRVDHMIGSNAVQFHLGPTYS